MAQQNYLQSLTPEVLQALARGQPYTTQDGYFYAPMMETTYNGADNQNTQQTGYYGGYLDRSGDMSLNDGRQYGKYDLNGNLIGQGQWSQGKDWFDSPLAPLLPILMAGGAYAMGLGSGAGAGTMANGAFLGEGMASGIPAWDLAATNAGMSLGAPAGAILQNSPMSLIPESAMPGTVTGYTGPTFGGVGAGAGAAGAAGSLLSGIGDKALGIGATVLGGALGSQGTPDQTQEKKMDPRMDQFVYGDLMPKVQGLLTSQMPLAQQAGDQMRMVGSGLLGQPIAPNGFERFTRGRY